MHKIKVETTGPQEIIDMTASVSRGLSDVGVMKGVRHFFDGPQSRTAAIGALPE